MTIGHEVRVEAVDWRGDNGGDVVLQNSGKTTHGITITRIRSTRSRFLEPSEDSLGQHTRRRNLAALGQERLRNRGIDNPTVLDRLCSAADTDPRLRKHEQHSVQHGAGLLMVVFDTAPCEKHGCLLDPARAFCKNWGTEESSMADDATTRLLMQRADQGDPSAAGELVDHHRDRLRRMVTFRLDPRLSARLDASDVVQDTLAEAVTETA